MQPYLTNLANRLMRQRSGIGVDEERHPDIGGLVDRTFLMLLKCNVTDSYGADSRDLREKVKG